MDSIEPIIGRSEPPDLTFNCQRIRVLDSLQDSGGLLYKCVATVAPVGYGKTVMMSLLMTDLRHRGKQCHWLTLDERDSGIDAILSGLSAMIKSGNRLLHPTHALLRGYDSSDKSIDLLIAALNSYPLPMIIFVDNLHFCTDAAVGVLLEQLIHRTRSSLQLVFSSTQELPIDTPRAQLAGLLHSVGAAELSFRASEIEAFLGQELSHKLTESGVQEVVRKTEGWPAAVRMAQIILTNTDNPAKALETFSGSDETLAQLLNRQALSGFSHEIRQFLLALSQLRTFSLELCQQAIGGNHIRRHLNYLIERNIFIVPLDRNQQWYRLHGLFRDHLLREAEMIMPLQERQAIALSAAHWCEQQGFIRDAIDYAFSSGNLKSAITMLDRIAPTFIRNRGASLQYIGWVEQLHQQGQSSGLETEYWYAWALAFHRRYEKARQQIKSLTQRLGKSSRKPAQTSADLISRIAILQVSIDNLTDHLQEAYLGASQWLSDVQRHQPDSFNLTAAYCIQCCYFTHTFEFVSARRAIQSARETAFQANSPYVDGWVSSYCALIGMSEGNYVSTYSELVDALTSIRAALGDDSGICGTMALIAADCAMQMGLETEALQLLELGTQSWHVHGFLDAVACGMEAALNLTTSGGSPLPSLSALREVAASYPRRLSLLLSCHLIRRLIQINRIEEARAEAESIGIDTQTDQCHEEIAAADCDIHLQSLLALTGIELRIALGKYKQAGTLIASQLQQARFKAGSANRVALELNSAALAVKSGNLPTAVRHVSRAVRIAATRRIVRPFQNHRLMLATLIDETKTSAWGFATEEEQRFFTETCRRLSPCAHEQVEKLSNQHNQTYLLDNLTGREHELLHLINTGLSNQQLADYLDVSIATVKWHLQNLYGKLGVSRRTAAIAKARTLNLLTR